MKKTRRLILNKQSIRNLTEARMAMVDGGGTLAYFRESAGHDCRQISIEGTGCP